MFFRRFLNKFRLKDNSLLPLNFNNRLLHSTRYSLNQNNNVNTNEDNKSLTSRFKELSKKYGWVAIGVYTAISIVDFSIAFGLVNFAGAQKVKAVERSILDFVGFSKSSDNGHNQGENDQQGSPNSLWAMIVLAYGIHKTLFLPPRLAIAAGITPRLVKELQRRGYAIGPNAEKMKEHMRRAKSKFDKDWIKNTIH